MNKLLYIIILTLITQVGFSQNSYTEKIKKFQDKINKEYADSATSPLTKEDLASFKSLEFYPIDKDFRINAKFKRTEKELPFKMETTTDRAPEYVKYGEIEFKLKGEKFKVNIYQSIRLREKEEYKDYLFLPFRDLSSGITSYGGGRYVDLKIPEGNTIIIDFNKAYNPYCAYNHKYSCVIPPSENFIDIEIKAGVKKQKQH